MFRMPALEMWLLLCNLEGKLVCTIIYTQHKTNNLSCEINYHVFMTNVKVRLHGGHSYKNLPSTENHVISSSFTKCITVYEMLCWSL